jgi:beta-lactamase class D
LLVGVVLVLVSRAAGQSVPGGPEPVRVRPEWNTFLTDCHVTGCVLVFDRQRNEWATNDSTEIRRAALPASTFKIINLLIALETGVIRSEKDVVKWPGQTDTTRYGYRPEIYHDMSVEEAFRESAGWVFVELAKKIGKTRYRRYLRACGYGNEDLSEPGADFWNFGAFRVSPVQQVQLVRALYEGRLPFRAAHQQTVRRVMRTEEGAGYAIHAKTGWTRADDQNTGWWVGYLERPEGVYFFATKLLQPRRQNRSDFGTCRKEITKAALRGLAAL